MIDGIFTKLHFGTEMDETTTTKNKVGVDIYRTETG